MESKLPKKCVKEVEDIELALDVQRERFHNECLLLLWDSGEDCQITSDMIADPLHPNWNDQELEKRLRQSLDESYNTCQRIIKHIHDTQEQMRSELVYFDQIRLQRVKGESTKTTFRRLQKTVQYVFDKSALEKKVDRLGKWNRDLKSLRKSQSQLRDLQRYTACTSRYSVRMGMPAHFSEIQRISNEAYSALTESFSCQDASHNQHHAALCLDTHLVDEVCLKMAITYVKRCPMNINFEPPVKFLLRSKTITTKEDTELATENQTTITSIQPSKPAENGVIACDTPFPPATQQTNRPSRLVAQAGVATTRGKRKVKFVDELDQSLDKKLNKTLSRGTTPRKESTTGPSINLCATESACEYLRKRCGWHEKLEEYSCIAFFQKPKLSKYIFYISTSQYSPEESPNIFSTKGISMREFLTIQRKDAITIVHQFKLALKLTLAVLQYNSTPWLKEEWYLSQLLLLSTPTELPEDFALYLNSTLPNLHLAPAPSGAQEIQMIETERTLLTEAQRQGVYNTTLFCLGVALLEIGHWKSLNDLREDYDRDNIETARRLAFGNTALGTCYDEVIRKCIQCNFGFGTDLTRTALQSAIYSDVVCPLESLIKDLSGLRI